MSQPSKILAALPLLAALPACSDADVSLIDEGRLCVYSPAATNPGAQGPPQTFASDQPVTVTVSTEECISACVDNEVATCSVSLSATTLTVGSELSYDEPPDGEGCIALCGSLTAQCESPPLPPGDYTIAHGSDRRALAIPSSDVPPCG